MTRSPRLRFAVAPLALALLAGAFALGVPRASASDPVPNTGIATLSSDHFQIHYSRDNADTVCPTRYISQERAGDVLQMAERAYAFYGSWGYTTPVLDGDGDSLLDISVDEFDKAPPTCITYGVIDPSIPTAADGSLSPWDALINPVAPAGAGEIHLDATNARGLKYHIVAREVFQLFGLAMDATADQWLQAGSAEWAAFRTENFATVTAADLGQNSNRSMDCVGSECGDTDVDRNGYSGWLLFEYLAERYGNDAVKAVWDEAAAFPGAAATTDLSNVLVTHGTTLSSFFNEYSTARLTGNFTVAAIAGVVPPSQASILVSASSGAIPAVRLAINHLAADYVALQHGADAAAPCYAATLTIQVAIPSGVTSNPYYYANTQGATAQALAISGSTASITVPWNTCAGSPPGYLSLPNGTLGLDAREFVVTGTVTVDKTTPAAPSGPPALVPVSGPVVTVPTSDPAPTLLLHAPEVLRVSAKTRLLRFIVFASGDGKLQATLGSTSLGSAKLRGGNNDVRFVLPQQLFKTLRAKTSSNLLELTSVSPSGTKGMTVTRRVVVQSTAKPKRRR